MAGFPVKPVQVAHRPFVAGNDQVGAGPQQRRLKAAARVDGTVDRSAFKDVQHPAGMVARRDQADPGPGIVKFQRETGGGWQRAGGCQENPGGSPRRRSGAGDSGRP